MQSTKATIDKPKQTFCICMKNVAHVITAEQNHNQHPNW